MQIPSIRIGSRGSKLALTMAQEVKNRLMQAHNLSDAAITIESISTAGDRIQDRSLSEFGGKGLFTQEIEKALSLNQIDIAVHSTKDVPTLLPKGLQLSAYLARHDPRDGFIGAKVKRFQDLPHGATIGTAALRRQAFVKKLRPDLKTIIFRGNLETRLKKLQRAEVDGTFLAMSGVQRLGLEAVITEIMDPTIFVPAPGQGVICLETRADDDRIKRLLAPLNDHTTTRALTCERQFLAALDGSCRTPLAAYARIENETLHFHGMILSPDGDQSFAVESKGNTDEAAAIGLKAAEKLRFDAGEDFFQHWQL